MGEKLLTVEEVSGYLGLSEGEIRDLVEKGELPAYKIGGSFLRFKRGQIETYRRRVEAPRWAEHHDAPAISRTDDSPPYSFWEKLEDFLYYNDFYILSLILLILIVLAVFKF